MKQCIGIIAVAGLLGAAAGNICQGQDNNAPASSFNLGVSEWPVGTMIAPGIYVKPSGVYFNPRGGLTFAQVGNADSSQAQRPPTGPQDSGTLIGPQRNQPRIGQRETTALGRQGGTAIGQQGSTALGQQNTTAIGQQGNTAIGPQGGTAIGQQNTTAIGQQGSTAIGPQPANGLAPMLPRGRPNNGTEFGPQDQDNSIQMGQQGSGTAIGPQANEPAVGTPTINLPAAGTPPPAAWSSANHTGATLAPPAWSSANSAAGAGGAAGKR